MLAPLLLVLAVPAVPVVAVFDIQDMSGKLSAGASAQLTAYLASKLVAGGVFQVVPRSQIAKLLEEQKAESYQSCRDEACQIELGKELAAEKVLSTQILQVGSQCAVSATLYDLRLATSERAVTRKGTCDQDALVAALEGVVAELEGPPPAGTPAPPSAASIANAVQVGGSGITTTDDPWLVEVLYERALIGHLGVLLRGSFSSNVGFGVAGVRAYPLPFQPGPEGWFLEATGGFGALGVGGGIVAAVELGTGYRLVVAGPLVVEAQAGALIFPGERAGFRGGGSLGYAF